MMTRTWVAVALAAAVVLTACGGGDDNESRPATESVPSDVSVSTTSFVTYLKALLASSADALEPVDVGMVTPATDDTADATPID